MVFCFKNKLLLEEDKFIPEMYLRKLGFAYNFFRQFTKNKGKIKKETGDSKYIYQNELDKVAFIMIWLITILNVYLEESLS